MNKLISTNRWAPTRYSLNLPDRVHQCYSICPEDFGRLCAYIFDVVEDSERFARLKSIFRSNKIHDGSLVVYPELPIGCRQIVPGGHLPIFKITKAGREFYEFSYSLRKNIEMVRFISTWNYALGEAQMGFVPNRYG